MLKDKQPAFWLFIFFFAGKSRICIHVPRLDFPLYHIVNLFADG
jgi:hypothetical protein